MVHQRLVTNTMIGQSAVFWSLGGDINGLKEVVCSSILISKMSLYIIGHSFIKRSFTSSVIAEFRKGVDDAFTRVKVAGHRGLTVPQLKNLLPDIQRFGASVVVVSIGTNDLGPSSVQPMQLAEDIVDILRQISEMLGVEAVVILPITPRAVEAPANSRHPWRPDFEEARLAVNLRVKELVGAMP